MRKHGRSLYLFNAGPSCCTAFGFLRVRAHTSFETNGQPLSRKARKTSAALTWEVGCRLRAQLSVSTENGAAESRLASHPQNSAPPFSAGALKELAQVSAAHWWLRLWKPRCDARGIEARTEKKQVAPARRAQGFTSPIAKQ